MIKRIKKDIKTKKKKRPLSLKKKIPDQAHPQKNKKKNRQKTK